METLDRMDLASGFRVDHARDGRTAFPSIWAFIAADCASFAIFFTVFMVERIDQAALFDESARSLDVGLGLLNTLILITSSWLVALAVNAARRQDMPMFRKLWLSAIVVGSGFGLVKVIEYGTKISDGITPFTNDFFSYYFVLTGVHFFHYLIGMAALVFLVGKVAKRSAVETGDITWLESGAIYWHMVDLLWVILFPMLYLLGGK